MYVSIKKQIKKTIPIGLYNRISVFNSHMRFFRDGIFSYYYCGKNVFCPCCQRNFKKFLPFQGSLLQAVCPRCKCHGRHRLMWLYLKKKKKIDTQHIKLLHFAPEYILRKNLCSLSNIEYLSADLSAPLAMVKIDITAISYPENSFDVILCSHVLEHIEEDRKAMSELFRVLKPGGWAILQVPIAYDCPHTLEDPKITSPEDRLKFYGQEDHVRYYGLDYADRLSEAGFDVTADRYVNTLDATLIKKYGLDCREDIYLCAKPIKPGLKCH